MHTRPTAEEVRERISYDPETGEFRWLTSVRQSRVGTIAGSVNHGYRQILIKGRLYNAHRLAWLIMTGEWPKALIDHQNMQRDDNRWCNLREADKRLNARNTGRRVDNTSGYKGVAWDAGQGRWRADINTGNGRKFLGFFDDPADGHLAYAAAAEKFFGEYGRLS